MTFPSFHAASAVLYGWALWPVRWMRPIAVLANVAMFASTPIDGGHYFIDLLGRRRGGGGRRSWWRAGSAGSRSGRRARR